MKITWDTNVNAPCAGQIVAEDGRTRLIQTDWDYPGVAQSFGWSLAETYGEWLAPAVDADGEPITDANGARPFCLHVNTDGTIDCACGCKVANFIESAREWLDAHDGDTADDPGYFE